MTPTAASQDSATLNRDLAEFLIEFSIALHKHAIYPEGHPLLASSEAGLAVRLAALLEERGTLSLGVARQQLVIEGVATDPSNSLLRDLAQRLHRHHLGAVKFARGVLDTELADLLRTLAIEGARVEVPLGLGPPEALRRWEHIRLFALTFEHLELLEEDDEEKEREEADLRDGHRFRAAQLWVGLARAALASEHTGDDSAPTPVSADPAAVARAIDEHQREQAYDQVIVGYLLQIASEVQHGGGAETAALKRRVSRLVSSLSPATLRQLLHMGGDTGQRRRFILEAVQGMAVDAVVELVRAAADTSGQTISHSLVRMLNKLAIHAESGPMTLRVGAEHALRDNVKRLIEGWNLGDPNPDAYRFALDAMSQHSTAPFKLSGDGEIEPERIIEMSLELGVMGPPTERALDMLAAAGRLGEIVAMLDAGAGDEKIRTALWAKISTPSILKALLDAPQPDLPLLERLVQTIGADAADLLLDAIENAEERSARWRLLDLLARLGPLIAESAVKRLDGAPWQVQRNLLVLLGRLPSIPPGFSPAKFVTHAEPRVRREAFKIQLRTPNLREAAIMSGLADADPRMVQLVLAAAADDCPLPAAPALMALLRGKTLDVEMRVLAIRALSQLRLPNVLEELLRHVEARRGLLRLGGDRLAPKSPTMLAALAGLAVHWSTHKRAAGVLSLARASTDSDVRGAVKPHTPIPAKR